jgi:hypothetical protein
MTAMKECNMLLFLFWAWHDEKVHDGHSSDLRGIQVRQLQFRMAYHRSQNNHESKSPGDNRQMEKWKEFDQRFDRIENPLKIPSPIRESISRKVSFTSEHTSQRKVSIATRHSVLFRKLCHQPA